MPKLSSLTLPILFVLAATPGHGAAQVGARIASSSRSGSIVLGSVFDHETGEALPDAIVTLGQGPRGALGLATRATDENGHFAFAAVNPGLYTIHAALVGRQTFTDTLRVEPGSEVRIVVKLPIAAIDLEPLVVSVNRPHFEFMEGFETRRANRAGTFITRDQVEQKNPFVVSDLLREVPGATFERLGPGYVMSLSGGCRPVIWVNGHRTFDETWTDYGIDEFVSAEQIEAIEVYNHIGEVPIQFGPTTCGAVVIWTRPPRPGTSEGFRWRPIFFSLGMLTLGLLFVH